jgi:hypothetical protein
MSLKSAQRLWDNDMHNRKARHGETDSCDGLQAVSRSLTDLTPQSPNAGGEGGPLFRPPAPATGSTGGAAAGYLPQRNGPHWPLAGV